MKTIAMLFILMAMLSVFPSNEAEAGIIGNSVKGIEYQFEKGDNLWNICKILCKSVSRDVTNGIAKENNIKNVRRILKGKKVLIAPKYLNGFLIAQVTQITDVPRVSQADSGQASQAAGEIQTLQSNLDLTLANNNVLATANDNLSKELSDTKVSLAKVADEQGKDQKMFFTVVGILAAVILVMTFFLINMAYDPNRSKELQESIASLNKEHEEYVQELSIDREEKIKNLKDVYAAEVARLQQKHLEELQKKEARSIEFEFDPDLFKGEFGQYKFGGEEVGSEKEVQEKLKDALKAYLRRDIYKAKEIQIIHALVENKEIIFT